MSKRIQPGDLSSALEEQLTIYSEAVNEKLAEVVSESLDDLVRLTKATAPKGKRGNYRKNIAADKSGLKKTGGKGLGGRAISGLWYVKAPDHRLTHLIVHGHAKKNGGRTKSNPFLQNALDKVLPKYEKRVEEATKS